MTWEARTEGQRKRAILIDEVTKDWRLSSGRLQWDATSVSQVYHAVLTQLASIPTSPQYGSRLHEPWKIIGTQIQELEFSLLSALSPLEDTKVIKAGSASVEVEPAGGFIVSVRVIWTDGGGEKQDLQVPIQPGFY